MDVSPTESLHRTLLEENRVLKELLKQAVKREADALRKLTHLSKLVKRRADGVTRTGSQTETVFIFYPEWIVRAYMMSIFFFAAKVQVAIRNSKTGERRT